jgi:hypothetical protein
MPTMTCPHCGRQIADQSKRCLYCGRLLPSSGASEAEVQADLRRSQQMAAIYEAGLGFGRRTRRTWIDELNESNLALKLLVSVLMLPLMLVAPFRVLRNIRAIFEP